MFKRKDNQKFFPVGESVILELESEFEILIGEFSNNAAQTKFLKEFLISKYSEKHRFYHNLSHINYLLKASEKHNFTDLEAVKFVIWFHDVIYDPKSTKNEIESAEIARVKLTELGLVADKISKIEKIILATQKHDSAGLDDDGELFLDLDLSILGADSETYQKYQKAIQSEYSFVPWFLYKRARRKILENFLQREFIYFTDEIRQTIESIARLNIQQEIKELS